MNEKVFNKKAKFFAFSLGIFLIIYCGLFVYSNLKANRLYDKAVSLEKPTAASELKKYYGDSLSLLSAAIKVNKANAGYLMAKADYLFMAIDDGLKAELSIKDSEIEDLYKSAIELSPINFEYHLKLGWFYSGRKKQPAEAELKKAIELCPMNHQAYAYLIKHYLKYNNDSRAFNIIISYLHNRGNQQYKWYLLWQEIKAVLGARPNLLMDYKTKEVKLIVYPQGNEFYLSEQGFSKERIPLRFRVFIKEPQAAVSLYKNNLVYAVFQKTEVLPGLFIHELYLDPFPENAYLNDLAIKSDPGSLIEKIEIIKH